MVFNFPILRRTWGKLDAGEMGSRVSEKKRRAHFPFHSSIPLSCLSFPPYGVRAMMEILTLGHTHGHAFAYMASIL
jgi:hypothetical protein